MFRASEGNIVRPYLKKKKREKKRKEKKKGKTIVKFVWDHKYPRSLE